jgi:hypothetical protein
MTVYLITYDLQNVAEQEENKQKVVDHLKKEGAMEVTRSSYVLHTPKSPHEVLLGIRKITDSIVVYVLPIEAAPYAGHDSANLNATSGWLDTALHAPK